MKCHYEVLGIERTADDKTIKNAYRKLALKFHPDKNPDNIEAAKQQFLLVQQAYDVLCDPHERAWYDNHRDQILRGSQSDYQDDSLDVFPYFTVSCYKGFGDDLGGFYGVYSEVFSQIAAEDIEFMDSPDDFEGIPKFGSSTSDYETVVGPFYAFWQSYCTKKTYSWLCIHNINEIRDRRILREIEKETKKIAQKARKERNEEVRALVAFVRKRDKRVLEYKKYLEEKAAQNRVKQQQHRLNQLKKNQQAAEEMRKNQQHTFNTSDHEEQLRQLEQAYGSDSEYTDDSDLEEIGEEENNDDDIVENGDTSEEESYIDDLYCVACNKAFKNASSYENHESSKKHRDNLERLKKRMQVEEQQHQEEEEEAEDDDEAVEQQAVDGDSNLEGNNENLLTGDIASEDEATQSKQPKQKLSKKSKKSKNKQRLKTDLNSDEGDDLEEIEKPIADISIGKISDEDTWSDDGKKNKKAKSKKSKASSSTSKVVTASEPATSTNGFETVDASKNKVMNKKSKKPEKKEEISVDPSVDVNHTCVTCHSSFDSKNKLFNHLKKMNHGVYIPKENGASATAAGSGKRGKKK